jgi:hypothetical protein
VRLSSFDLSRYGANATANRYAVACYPRTSEEEFEVCLAGHRPAEDCRLNRDPAYRALVRQPITGS